MEMVELQGRLVMVLRIQSLIPFIDAEGIFRVGGRLQNVMPNSQYFYQQNPIYLHWSYNMNTDD